MKTRMQTRRKQKGTWRKSILTVHKEMARHNLKSKQATISGYVR